MVVKSVPLHLKKTLNPKPQTPKQTQICPLLQGILLRNVTIRRGLGFGPWWGENQSKPEAVPTEPSTP